jgi:hypothetical protein
MRVSAVAAWAAVATIAVLGSGAPARAVTIFNAWLVYEDPLDQKVWLPIPVTTSTLPDGTVVGTIANWTWQCTVTCADGGFQVADLDVTLDTDPLINFGVSTVDFGAPSTFGYVFQQSIVPTTAPGTATSSLSGSTTNGGGGPGVVSVTPAPPPAGISQDAPGTNDEIMVYSLSTNGGTTWLNAGIDLGPAFSSNPALVSDNYGSFNSAMVPGPAGSGSYDTMRVDVNFTMSGGGDRFTFNGDATITEEMNVPEPSTAALLSLGLLGMGMIRRRQRA